MYTPSTDFVGLWRAISGGVQKVEMPGLDFVISGLGRAGIINLSTAGSAPTSNQSTTAWLQPAATSYAAEGVFQLWNATASAYQNATMRLLLEMLAAAEKVAAVPTAISSLLDTLSTTQGAIAFRGSAGWQAINPGVAGQFLATGGPSANPSWLSSSGVTSFNGRNGVVVPVQGDYPANLIPGTGTNDNAIAGNIGEYLTNNNNVNLTLSAWTSVVSLTLTAGDWDVWGVAAATVGTGATMTLIQAMIHNVANSGGGLPSWDLPVSVPAAGNVYGSLAPIRYSLAGSSTVYVNVYAVASGGTVNSTCYLFARRRR